MANQPQAFAVPLLIAEDGPTGQPYGGELITLQEFDAPHGQSRDEVGFEQGGSLNLGDPEGTYYPGRSKPNHFVNQFRFTNPTFHGALRDHLWGEAGHSQKIVDALLRVAARGRYCTVTWRDFSFTALLGTPKLEREDVADWRYELTFLLSEVSGTEQKDGAQQQAARVTDSLVDVVAQLQADLAAARARLLAQQIEVQLRTRLVGGLDAIETGLLSTQRAVASLEASTLGRGKQLVALARRVDSEAAAVQAQCKQFSDDVGGLKASVAVTVRTATTATAFVGLVADLVLLMLSMRASLRRVRGEAGARVQESTQLYRVEAGDTVESIAQKKLGSRARAAELGITDRDLVVGQTIELPGA